jgi:hypothetical protein
MKLDLQLNKEANIYFNELIIEEVNAKLSVFTPNSDGTKSNEIFLSISKTEEVERDLLTLKMNRNEANYLMHILAAFLSEKNIDPNAVD